jgi:hypothetical protein
MVKPVAHQGHLLRKVRVHKSNRHSPHRLPSVYSAPFAVIYGLLNYYRQLLPDAGQAVPVTLVQSVGPAVEGNALPFAGVRRFVGIDIGPEADAR